MKGTVHVFLNIRRLSAVQNNTLKSCLSNDDGEILENLYRKEKNSKFDLKPKLIYCRFFQKTGLEFNSELFAFKNEKLFYIFFEIRDLKPD